MSLRDHFELTSSRSSVGSPPKCYDAVLVGLLCSGNKVVTVEVFAGFQQLCVLFFSIISIGTRQLGS